MGEEGCPGVGDHDTGGNVAEERGEAACSSFPCAELARLPAVYGVSKSPVHVGKLVLVLVFKQRVFPGASHSSRSRWFGCLFACAWWYFYHFPQQQRVIHVQSLFLR